MIELPNHNTVDQAIDAAMEIARKRHHEFVTPEHLLFAILQQPLFISACNKVCDDGRTVKMISTELEEYIKTMPVVDHGVAPEPSSQLVQAMKEGEQEAEMQGRQELTICDALWGVNMLHDSFAASCVNVLAQDCEGDDFFHTVAQEYQIHWCSELDAGMSENVPTDLIDFINTFISDHKSDSRPQSAADSQKSWTKYAPDITQELVQWNPLIGRETELERVMQVLCRKSKNNPILVGESGVGKTAIVYGLASLLASDSVPSRLKGCSIHRLELGMLLAGTQFRGEFEERLTGVLDAIAASNGKSILFIDEIHLLIGTGGGDGNVDASGLLQPYLDRAAVRIIGTTTYEEYNHRMSKNQALLRRLQKIDIAEPTHDETVNILKALVPSLEDYHGVKFNADVVDYAVNLSDKHLPNRFRPDKCIDLMDESGAYLQLHPSPKMEVDKTLIANVLAKMANVDSLSIQEGDEKLLETLEKRVKSKIFGQDEAVKRVVEAVQMAKAGLVDDEKPLASLLFVGPTGVGKTEVARVLAREMNVELVRFDMSEYAEKHTVAKFIGSPAGYVGYDDGGQLTDAVRKHPDCVLLFDEIEKAHSDIFDTLLQVMDYGVLTDNKGRKAHFHNVVIIMTSNAGAQWAHAAGVGFASTVTTGSAMLTEVKKTFKPEFVNRLSGIVVFNEMSQEMANLVLNKKLDELKAKLRTRQVRLKVSKQARERLLAMGFSGQYGAREMDRVITQHVKSLLMREILFGSLRKGGTAMLKVKHGELLVET